MANLNKMLVNEIEYDIEDASAVHTSDIVQTTGTSETAVMSQATTTEEINDVATRNVKGAVVAITEAKADTFATFNFQYEQEGEGNPTPSNIRAISGKQTFSASVCGSNILKLQNSEWVERNGIQWKLENGKIWVQGTATDYSFTDRTSLGEIQLPKKAATVTLGTLPTGVSGGIINRYADNSVLEFAWSRGIAILDPNADTIFAYFYVSPSTTISTGFIPIVEVGLHITDETSWRDDDTDSKVVVNLGKEAYRGSYNTGTGALTEELVLYTIDENFESKTIGQDGSTAGYWIENVYAVGEGGTFNLYFQKYNDDADAVPAIEKVTSANTIIVACDRLTPSSGDSTYLGTPYTISALTGTDGLTNGITLYIDGTVTTVEELRAWLALNPVNVLVKRRKEKKTVVAPTNAIKMTGKKQTIWFDDILADITFSVDVGEALDKLETFDFLKYANGLPILYLSGDIESMTKENAVTLSYKYGNRSGSCDVKWQGSSSINYPEKNFTVKFDNAFEVVSGWGSQKKYCMKANYIDFSQARNVCAAKLWGQVVKSRSGTDSLTTALKTLPNGGAIDGFPILIVLNGEFYGIYTFNIPKDGWMFGMGGGVAEYILCAENHGQPERFKAVIADSEDIEDSFAIEYAPDGVGAATITSSLNALIQAAINAVADSTLLGNLDALIDWQSAIDYYIFTCLIRGDDMTDKNYLLATYDGTKWFFSAYDMDSIFGLQWDGKKLQTAKDGTTFTSYAYMHNLMGLIKTHKTAELKSRYATLREGVLSEDNVVTTFSNFIGQIPSNAYEADRKRWNNKPSTEVNNMSQIADWYRRRVAIMDDAIDNL